MGGDEFAIFLPATDEKGAEKVLKNMRQKLLDQVAAEEWGIGYSIGAVTLDPKLNEVPSHAEVILQADHLMYDIKKSGKNNLTVKQYKQK
jgi:diguanylate cyclase (GGDEF)-like protein